MAGVLEHRLVAQHQGDPHRPGPGPHRRVGDGDLVVEGSGTRPGQPLDEVEAVGRPAEVGGRREVGRFDHQRVALPVAARVAVQLPHGPGQVRLPGQGDDPRVVNHLVHEDEVVRVLEDLEIAVVARAQPREPVGDAALRQRPVGEAVGGMRAAVGGGGAEPLARLRGHRGDAAVRRIDHQRGAVVEVPLGDPELVVVAGRGVVGGRLHPLDGRQHELVAEQRVAVADRVGGRHPQRRQLLLAEGLAARPRLGALERRDVVVGPDPLQVGTTVGGAGRGPFRTRLGGRLPAAGRDHRGQNPCRHPFLAHETPTPFRRDRAAQSGRRPGPIRRRRPTAPTKPRPTRMADDREAAANRRRSTAGPSRSTAGGHRRPNRPAISRAAEAQGDCTSMPHQSDAGNPGARIIGSGGSAPQGATPRRGSPADGDAAPARTGQPVTGRDPPAWTGTAERRRRPTGFPADETRPRPPTGRADTERSAHD